MKMRSFFPSDWYTKTLNIPPLPSSQSLNLPPTALLSTVHKSLSNFSIVGAFLAISVASYRNDSCGLTEDEYIVGLLLVGMMGNTFFF